MRGMGIPNGGRKQDRTNVRVWLSVAFATEGLRKTKSPASEDYLRGLAAKQWREARNLCAVLQTCTIGEWFRQ